MDEEEAELEITATRSPLSYEPASGMVETSISLRTNKRYHLLQSYLTHVCDEEYIARPFKAQPRYHPSLDTTAGGKPTAVLRSQHPAFILT